MRTDELWVSCAHEILDGPALLNAGRALALEVTGTQISTPVTFALALTTAVLLVAAIVWVALAMRTRRWVAQTSTAIQELDQLNARFGPLTAPHPSLRFDFRYPANSKPKFDRFDLTDYAHREILENETWFNAEIARRLAAVDQFVLYSDARTLMGARFLGTSTHPRVKSDRFRVIEQKLFAKRALVYPEALAAVRFTVTYTSPQGRNSYARHFSCDFDQIRQELQVAVARRARQSTVQATRQRERALMTSALRVEILRRDGNRCKMCGISVRDGATLHIDHIVPVSRGGRTTRENLQALCDSCNSGKSNRFVG